MNEHGHTTIDGVDTPEGATGKTLELRNPDDGPFDAEKDVAQLTIVTADGRRESINVLTGDVRSAFFVEGFPEGAGEQPAQSEEALEQPKTPAEAQAETMASPPSTDEPADADSAGAPVTPPVAGEAPSAPDAE